MIIYLVTRKFCFFVFFEWDLYETYKSLFWILWRFVSLGILNIWNTTLVKKIFLKNKKEKYKKYVVSNK